MYGNVAHPAIASFAQRSGMNATPGAPMFLPSRRGTPGGSQYATGDGTAASDNTIVGVTPNQQAGIKLGFNLGNVGNADVSTQVSAAFIGLMVVGIAAFYYVTRKAQL